MSIDVPVTRRHLIGSEELVRRSGASYRQIDYWARVGYLVPAVPAHGSGTHRQYVEADVYRARCMAALSNIGRSDFLKTIGTEDGPWVFDAGRVRITVEPVGVGS